MPTRGLRFRNRLLGRAGEARDHRDRPLGPRGRGLGRQLQHRAVQADIADGKLRGVHADSQSAGAGIEIIARQRALMPDVERAVGIERERMRGEYRAVGDQLANFGLDFTVVHVRCSYPNSGPATANGSCAGGAVGRPKRMR